MKLSDLPSMTVERIERGSDGLAVEGRFDRLDGVREGGCFRLSRGVYVWANLVVSDRASGLVVVTDARDRQLAQLRVGERYTWLDDYWQMPLVEAIADEALEWQQFNFAASDAACFKQGTVIGWQQVGRDLPAGVVDLGVKSGGWDHEHCGLCDARIDESAPVGYTDNNGQFLCSECYARYGATHDVSFQVGA